MAFLIDTDICSAYLKGTPVADMLIAGTALVHNLTVVTHNVDHYRVVPDLRIVDWLAEN